MHEKIAMIDNSALCNLIKSQKEMGKINFFFTNGGKLIISDNVTWETASGARYDCIYERIKRLMSFYKLNIDNVIFTKEFSYYLRKELKGKGRKFVIPNLKNSADWLNFIFHDVFKLFENVISDKLQSETLSKKVTTKLKRKIKKAYYCIQIDRFVYMKVYLVLLIIRLCGDAIQNFDKLLDLKFLAKIHKGNYYDLAILAQASQFDYLITDDKDQMNFCNYMKSSCKIFKAEGISLQDFLKQHGAY